MILEGHQIDSEDGAWDFREGTLVMQVEAASAGASSPRRSDLSL